MKTLRNLRNILGVSLLVAIVNCCGSIGTAYAMSGPSQANQYAKLMYMGKQCHFDQNFVIGYHAIYDAQIFSLLKEKKEKKRVKEKMEYDKISGKILDYLRNPNVTVIFNESGKISFAGPQPPYSGDKTDRKLNKQERKDNEKAGKLYGTVVKTAVNEWYKKYSNKCH